MALPRPARISASALLDLWEQGEAYHSLDQALLVLERAYPAITREELAAYSIGRRDRLLLQVHCNLFGDRIDGCVACPSCGTKLEFGLSCSALAEPRGDDHPVKRTVQCGGGEWEVRPPNSRDLAAVANQPDVQIARQMLLARCVASVVPAQEQTSALPPDTQRVLEAELATLDPHAEVFIDLSCQACAHSWQTLFDIASFLWSEIRTKARRLLQEVDVLARAYGWTQHDILTLSPTRRSWYVQMALS